MKDGLWSDVKGSRLLRFTFHACAVCCVQSRSGPKGKECQHGPVIVSAAAPSTPALMLLRKLCVDRFHAPEERHVQARPTLTTRSNRHSNYVPDMETVVHQYGRRRSAALSPIQERAN
jgi:hypothetical protein